MNSGELKWYKTQTLNIEKKFLVLEKEINYHCKRNKIEDCDQRKNTKELVSTEKRLTLENDSHCMFLQALLEMMTSQAYLVSGLENAPENLKWAKLASLVYSSVQSMKMAFGQAREEIAICKNVMEKQSSLLACATQRHEEMLSQHEVEEEEREKQWENRLAEIKRKYELLLMDRDNGSTAIETQVRNCVCELEESKKVRDHLEQSNKNLKLQLTQLSDVQKLHKHDRACLLSCVSLMTGTVLACLHRLQQLHFQKQFLVRLSKSIQTTETQVRLANHFRSIALVVLAANRLRRLRSESTRLHMQNHSGYSVIIPYIGLKPSRRTSNASSLSLELAHSDTDISQWLRSEQVLSDVRQCFSSLQSTLDSHTLQQHRNQDPNRVGRSLRPCIESAEGQLGDRDLTTNMLKCHSNFINMLQTHFYFGCNILF